MCIWRAVREEGSELGIWPEPRALSPQSLAGIGIIENKELELRRDAGKSILEQR